MAETSLIWNLIAKDQASSVFEKTGKSASSAGSVISGAFGKLGGVIGGEFGDLLNRVSEGISNVDEHASKLSTGMAVGGAAVTGLGVALQSLGSADKQARDQLNQSITASGHSSAAYTDQIEKMIASQEGFGHSASDTQQALTKLTASTNDPKKALADMGIVANLAASKHISLSDAAALVARVINGTGGKALATYGIQMQAVTGTAVQLAKANAGVSAASNGLALAQDKLSAVQAKLSGKTKLTAADHLALQKAQMAVKTASGKLSTAQDVLAKAHSGASSKAAAGQVALTELSKKLDGQASASVNNFSAQVNIMKTRLTDWASDVGQHVGPALTALGPVLSVVSVGMELMKTRQAAAAAATLVAAGATDVQTVSTEAATVAQTGLNLAFLANPIFLVIAGIVLLVAGFIWLWNNVKGFRDFFINAFKIITNVIAGVIGWVGKNWPLLLAIIAGPIGLAVLFIIKNWGAIVSFVTTTFARLFTGLKIIGNAISGWWNRMWKGFGSFITGAWNGYISLVRSGFTRVFNGLKTVGNAIRSWWSGLWKGFGHLIAGAFSGVVGIVKGVINSVITVIDNVIRGINGIGGAIASATGGAINVHIGTIPHLATGGTYTSGGMALVGENGPEIVKLPGNSTVYPNGTPMGGGGGGLTVNVQTGPGMIYGTPAQLAKELQTVLINAIRSGQVQPLSGWK